MNRKIIGKTGLKSSHFIQLQVVIEMTTDIYTNHMEYSEDSINWPNDGNSSMRLINQLQTPFDIRANCIGGGKVSRSK